MYAFYVSHKKTFDMLLFLMVIVLSFFAFFKYLFSYVAPFVVGFIISLLMEPIIRMLLKRAHFKRWLASLSCLLLFLFAVGGLGTVIVTKLYREMGAFLTDVPRLIDEYALKLDGFNTWLVSWSEGLPDSFPFMFPDVREAIVELISVLFGDGVRVTSLQIVSNVPAFFLALILTLVSAFFFMKDRPLILDAMRSHAPSWLLYNLHVISNGLSRAASGYFRAQFTLMSITGIISISGLLLLRSPYALFVGVIIAVLDFLPIFGSGTILIPWTLFSFLTGLYSQAIGLLVLYGIITITRQSLEPKIVGEHIGIHPLLTLISLYAGVKIFGFLGFLIGPSLIIILKAVYDSRNVQP